MGLRSRSCGENADPDCSILANRPGKSADRAPSSASLMKKELRDEEPPGSRSFSLSNAASRSEQQTKLAALDLTIRLGICDLSALVIESRSARCFKGVKVGGAGPVGGATAQPQ